MRIIIATNVYIVETRKNYAINWKLENYNSLNKFSNRKVVQYVPNK